MARLSSKKSSFEIGGKAQRCSDQQFCKLHFFFAAVANVTSKYSTDNKYLYHFIFVTLYFADCISQHIKSYKSIFKSIEIQKVCGRKKRMARDTKHTRVHFYTLNSPFSALLPLTIGFTK